MIIAIDWEKCNPRLDSKKPSWFRFDHDFFDDKSFADFDLEERMIWVAIMCLCSPNCAGQTRLCYQRFYEMTGVRPEKIDQALLKLCKIKKVKLKEMQEEEEDISEARAMLARASHKVVQDSQGHVQDSPTTDGRDETGRRRDGHLHKVNADALPPRDPPGSSKKAPKKRSRGNGEDLDPLRENIYEVYPKRGKGQNMGKGPGMRKLKSIHSKEKLERIKVAAQNYAVAQKKNGNANTKYTMQFKTFLNNWEEWESAGNSKPKKRLRFGGEECSQNDKSIL